MMIISFNHMMRNYRYQLIRNNNNLYMMNNCILFDEYLESLQQPVI
jgi:hypothetical protein